MSSDNITELAKLFKERDNPFQLGIQKGEIISVNPLEIRLSEAVILKSKHLTLSYTFSLLDKQPGQKVILIPTTSHQHYFVIDRVG
ncbi:DUF2577 family protein [Metabacillus litoralis]|uniref:DUF2577 family protein n=1 Tax=Metabacillus litoralis TaxID=152268 RepID=UPI0020416169|nr:DUF2577 domain-containing protein [Metabacillus litoralis]